MSALAPDPANGKGGRRLDEWDGQFNAIAIDKAIKENGGKITRALLHRAMTDVSGEDVSRIRLTSLGFDLVEAGFATMDDLVSEPMPVPIPVPIPVRPPDPPSARLSPGVGLRRWMVLLGSRLKGRPR
jgi:hypothetical protein